MPYSMTTDIPSGPCMPRRTTKSAWYSHFIPLPSSSLPTRTQYNPATTPVARNNDPSSSLQPKLNNSCHQNRILIRTQRTLIKPQRALKTPHPILIRIDKVAYTPSPVDLCPIVTNCVAVQICVEATDCWWKGFGFHGTAVSVPDCDVLAWCLVFGVW